MKRALIPTTLAAALILAVVPAASAVSPVPGQACTKIGAVSKQTNASGTVTSEWTCIRYRGQLVWKLTKTPDLGAQPVPIDGKWLVNPGFPTELPPVGYAREPKWFSANWDIATAQSIGACTTTTPLNRYLTDLTRLDSITPMGFSQPGFHALPVPHMYYNTGAPTDTVQDAQGRDYVSEKVPVYAPVDMTLRGVAISRVALGQSNYVEYIVSFSICGNYWLWFAHLDNLSNPIKRAYPTAPRKECQNPTYPNDCNYNYLSVRVKAGDIIAYSSGRSAGFDVGFIDTSSPTAGRLDPRSYSPRWAASRCHIDYYPSQKRAALQAKLLGDNGCGQLVSDKAATLAGVWLDPNFSSTREDFHMAIAKSPTEAGRWRFAIGMDTQIPQVGWGVWEFTPTASGANKDPEAVGRGVVACYDAVTLSGQPGSPRPTIFVKVTQLTSARERLQIGGSTGACGDGPWAMPAETRTFERNTNLR